MTARPGPTIAGALPARGAFGRRLGVALALALALDACASVEALLEDAAGLFEPPAVNEERARARAGDAAAAYGLGVRYAAGNAVARDAGAAVRWFRRAAEAGHAEAQYALGVALDGGRGVAEDATEAARWFQEAANRGHAAAAFRLGEAFAGGRGVDKESLWAARWFGEAAEAGLADAQYALGYAYAAGLGFAPDGVEALKWLILAENQGHEEAAALRPTLADKLPWEERFRAEQRALAWAGGKGSRAPLVRFVQETLTRLGYPAGPTDGIEGPRTRAAVARFRNEASLVGEGIDAAMLERLRAEMRAREGSL